MKRLILGSILIILITGITTYIYRSTFSQAGPEEITVKQGEVVQEVSVTGQITSAQSVDLAFEKAGKVVNVTSQVGDHVKAGQLLISLNNADLLAQLAQAQASVQSAQAKLEELRQGATPEEIQVVQIAVDNAKQAFEDAQANLVNVQHKAEVDLTNLYARIPNSLLDAYVKMDDAITRQTDEMFIDDLGATPKLTFKTSDLQAQIDGEWQRFTVGESLKNFKAEIDTLGVNPIELDQGLAKAQEHYNALIPFLSRLNDALNSQINLSASTLAMYRNNVSTARGEASSSLASLQNLRQSIAAQKVLNQNALGQAQSSVNSARNALLSAQSQLSLKRAGSPLQSIQAQEAQVRQAQANVQSINAQIAKTQLYSPLEGIVTKQEAKVGEIVAPNSILVSIIVPASMEVQANIPEVDIGKVALGNPVAITIDALPGEIFKGTVIQIDPAPTIVEGVSNFKVRISFDKEEARFKSGLTANLAIETLRKSNVLTLPQVAILENDKGTFVRENDARSTKDVLVVIGVRGRDGIVEVLSGVSEGQKVLNIGEKVTK